MAPLAMSFSLQIEDQDLVEFDLSAILDRFDFNGFMFCPWAMSFFQKLCLTPSLLFHALFLSPVQAHNVASTIFWRDNQKIAGPWEGNTVKYQITLDIQVFIFHISYNMCNHISQ